MLAQDFEYHVYILHLLIVNDQVPQVKLLQPPRHIMCNTPEHTFLLSSGQSTSKHFKAREAKYGKFAYSSSFGFSVPCGNFLEQIASDSTLAICFNTQEDNWKVRWDPYDVEYGEMTFGGETVPTLTSTWKPWKDVDVAVQTTLIPPVKQWPGWTQRVHRVVWTGCDQDDSILKIVDSGFAASAQTTTDQSIFEEEPATTYGSVEEREGWWIDKRSALVISESGASGIVDLTASLPMSSSTNLQSRAINIRADPNTYVPKFNPAIIFGHS